MTKVFYREHYDRTLIIIEGHSNFAEYGKDIVCAGISTLIFTLVNMVLDEECYKRLKLIRNIVRDGYVCLEFESFDFSEERISGVVDTVMTGFLMLAEQYPKHIIVE